jgi:hypothetical protein
MSFLTRALIPGLHLLVFPEADNFTKDADNLTVSATPASRTAKPGSQDSGWIDIGVIEEGDIQVEASDIEIFAPKPGKLVLWDELTTKEKLTGSATLKEVSPYALEVLFRSARLTAASTQFNSLSGGKKRGWLQVQVYDDQDDQILVKNIWASLKIAGAVPLGGAKLMELKLEFKQLYSTLNTSTLVS